MVVTHLVLGSSPGKHPYGSIVQWLEHWPVKPKIRIRVPLGPLYASIEYGLIHLAFNQKNRVQVSMLVH